jgi:transcriptional regulator with XRE-family HTH domain
MVSKARDLTMNQNEIGTFIAAKRREKNLTQEALAEILGVSNQTVSKWENGKSMPDYAVIELLCQELDITLSELLGAREQKLPDSEEYSRMLYRIKELEQRCCKRGTEKGHQFSRRDWCNLRLGTCNGHQLCHVEVGRLGDTARRIRMGIRHILSDQILRKRNRQTMLL